MGTHPWANTRRYLQNSPYYNADKITTPVLIVHGTKDDAYSDAGKFFSALRRLGKPAQLASYQDQGHVIYEWRRASAIDAAQRMVESYRKHFGRLCTTRDPNVIPCVPGEERCHSEQALQLRSGQAPRERVIPSERSESRDLHLASRPAPRRLPRRSRETHPPPSRRQRRGAAPSTVPPRGACGSLHSLRSVGMTDGVGSLSKMLVPRPAIRVRTFLRNDGPPAAPLTAARDT